MINWLLDWSHWLMVSGGLAIVMWLGIERWMSRRRTGTLEMDLSLERAQGALRDDSKVRKVLDETERSVADVVAIADGDRVRWLDTKLAEDAAALGSDHPKDG